MTVLAGVLFLVAISVMPVVILAVARRIVRRLALNHQPAPGRDEPWA